MSEYDARRRAARRERDRLEVHAAVMRSVGHARRAREVCELARRVSEVVWAQTLDEQRDALAGVPPMVAEVIEQGRETV